MTLYASRQRFNHPPRSVVRRLPPYHVECLVLSHSCPSVCMAGITSSTIDSDSKQRVDDFLRPKKSSPMIPMLHTLPQQEHHSQVFIVQFTSAIKIHREMGGSSATEATSDLRGPTPGQMLSVHGLDKMSNLTKRRKLIIYFGSLLVFNSIDSSKIAVCRSCGLRPQVCSPPISAHPRVDPLNTAQTGQSSR